MLLSTLSHQTRPDHRSQVNSAVGAQVRHSEFSTRLNKSAASTDQSYHLLLLVNCKNNSNKTVSNAQS